MQDYLFAKLPIALIKCGLFRELKPSSVVVYNVLLSHADFNTGTCFPSLPTICDLSGLSRPTVIDSIKELEDWGLVDVIRRPGDHNVYQIKYWWGSRKLSTILASPERRNSVGSEATSTKNLTGGVKNFNPSSKISCTLTTTNNKNHINRTNVVNRPESENSSASLAVKETKRLLYQLRIAEIQQQQAWVNTIQELFRRKFNKELPAELIDEKFAQGIDAQFLMKILKNIDDPAKVRNPIGWFRSISEDWIV